MMLFNKLLWPQLMFLIYSYNTINLTMGVQRY